MHDAHSESAALRNFSNYTSCLLNPIECFVHSAWSGSIGSPHRGGIIILNPPLSWNRRCPQLSCLGILYFKVSVGFCTVWHNFWAQEQANEEASLVGTAFKARMFWQCKLSSSEEKNCVKDSQNTSRCTATCAARAALIPKIVCRMGVRWSLWCKTSWWKLYLRCHRTQRGWRLPRRWRRNSDKADKDGCGAATTIWTIKTAEVLDLCNILQPGFQQTKVVSNL